MGGRQPNIVVEGKFKCDLKEKANILNQSNTASEFCPHCLVNQHSEGFVGPICQICKPIFPDSKYCFCRSLMDSLGEPNINWIIPDDVDLKKSTKERLKAFLIKNSLSADGNKDVLMSRISNFYYINKVYLRVSCENSPNFVVNATSLMLDFELKRRIPDIELLSYHIEAKREKLIRYTCIVIYYISYFFY